MLPHDVHVVEVEHGRLRIRDVVLAAREEDVHPIQNLGVSGVAAQDTLVILLHPLRRVFLAQGQSANSIQRV